MCRRAFNRNRQNRERLYSPPLVTVSSVIKGPHLSSFKYSSNPLAPSPPEQTGHCARSSTNAPRIYIYRETNYAAVWFTRVNLSPALLNTCTRPARILGTPENSGRDARVGIGPRLWSCRATDASVNRTNRGWSGATRRAWSTEHLTNPRVRAEINEGGRGLSTARLNRHAILEGHAFTRKMRWKIYGEGRRYADIV